MRKFTLILLLVLSQCNPTDKMDLSSFLPSFNTVGGTPNPTAAAAITEKIISGDYKIQGAEEEIPFFQIRSYLRSSNLYDNWNSVVGFEATDIQTIQITISEIRLLGKNGESTDNLLSEAKSLNLLELSEEFPALTEKIAYPEFSVDRIQIQIQLQSSFLASSSTQIPIWTESITNIYPLEFKSVRGLLGEVNLEFILDNLTYNSLKTRFEIGSRYLSVNQSQALPFQLGTAFFKLKADETTSEAEAFLEKYELIQIFPAYSDIPEDKSITSNQVGLDRIYIATFPKTIDILEVVFGLSRLASVEWATVDQKSQGSLTPNDTYYSYQSSYLNSISAPTGWNYSTGSSSVTIAIVDTGIDDTHPDLNGRIVQNRSFYSKTCYHWGIVPYLCLDSTSDSRPRYPTYNANFHGTHVAGIAGASGNNGAGVAGISWNNPILSINTFQPIDGSLLTTQLALAQGIIEATNKGAKIINMSLGGPGYSYCQWTIASFCIASAFSYQLTADAVDYAYKNGVTLVAAAGNDGVRRYPYPGTPSQPGNYPSSFSQVISVGNLGWPYDSKAISSNFGKVDIAAPGSSIFSTLPGGSYGYASGTSMAAPVISGFAGLILSMDPSQHPTRVLDDMCSHTTALTDVSDPQLNKDYYGCGRANIGASLQSKYSAPPRPSIVMNCGIPGKSYCVAGRHFLPWSYQFVVTSGTAPYTWSATGKLPTFSTLNPNTGVIGGAATWWWGPGWTFNVTVTDANGMKDTKTVYFQSSL